MCGLVGIVSPTHVVSESLLCNMRDTLTHRGPDDAGAWTQNGVGLAHRRLAVVDLSPAGHQPMHSENGEWVIVFNGEVYNFTQLKVQLGDRNWRGTSDTEVIIEAFATWGVERSLKKFVGMFSLAAYNRKTAELWLARDRMGIKPLYYGWFGDHFAFSSELTPLRALGRLDIDRDALASYLRHGYVPNPHSIFSSVRKLAPGHFCRINTQRLHSKNLPITEPYWTLEHAANPIDIGDEEAEDTLLNHLREAVRDRMVADVPLGAFLSGGYDSSLVCALMQEASTLPTKTFTIGFDDPRYNEAQHAKEVAAHLGTQHTELYIGEQDLLDAIQKLPLLCDEPFADSSILPTYLVSHLARRDVTVALSGDGGDELFWGYQRYQVAERIWNTIRYFPRPIRRAIADIARSPRLQDLTRNIKTPAWGGRRGTLNQKLAAAAELMASQSRAETYLNLISQYKDPNAIVMTSSELETAYTAKNHWTHERDHYAACAWQDALQYLPDDILTKVDRASMRVSLEARVPLLDHRVVEFSATLPAHLKRRDGQDKYLLRRVLNRYVPSTLTDRPKMGFGVPLDAWLRGPLRDWTCDLLSPERLRSQALLEPAPIERLLFDHLEGRSNNSVKLWNILMLQVWLDAAPLPTID